MQREELIDATFFVKTPENIAFRYNVAGPFRRAPAFLLDIAIKVTVMVLLSMIVAFAIPFTQLGAIGAAVWLLVYFIIDWFYGGFFEAYMNGQTPGKWLLGLRVVNIDGQPINGMQAIMRNLLRGADWFPLLVVAENLPPFPVFPLVGLIVMSLNRRYQRLGDLACSTIVVVEEKPWLTGMAKLDDARAIQLASFIPPNFVVSRTLAKALSTYVERRRFFAAPRRKEMAAHIARPLLERFGLPQDTSYDLLLCALYYRNFIADRGDDERHLAAARQTNPFALVQP